MPDGLLCIQHHSFLLYSYYYKGEIQKFTSQNPFELWSGLRSVSKRYSCKTEKATEKESKYFLVVIEDRHVDKWKKMEVCSSFWENSGKKKITCCPTCKKASWRARILMQDYLKNRYSNHFSRHRFNFWIKWGHHLPCPTVRLHLLLSLLIFFP